MTVSLPEIDPDFFDQKNEILSFFSPGRVNIIGEHLDYNGGYVFPAAISLGIYGFLQYRDDSTYRLRSRNFPGDIIFNSDEEILYREEFGWGNFPMGIIKYLKIQGHEVPKGCNIFFDSNLPVGSGLSSSASMEVLTAIMMTRVSHHSESGRIKLAELAKDVENRFIGVHCGIMDQFSIAMGRKDHAILLDTESLSYKHIPFTLDDYSLLIMNTNKPRKLSDSKYNTRREECMKALEYIRSEKDIANLAEALPEDIDLIPDDTLKKRARHVITENRRVLESVKILSINDIASFGPLLSASHNSLKNDYEVTGIELDTLVAAAQEIDGCIGARMTGAGFGGCAIALVKKENINELESRVSSVYTSKTGLNADFYIAQIVNGAEKIITG